MKLCPHSSMPPRGSVLVVALLLIVAGTLGMASMTTLIGARSRYVMDMEHAIQRRIAQRNCRALLSTYFMRQGIAAPDEGGTLSLGAWGSVDIPATTTSPLGSQQEFSLVNYLSPALEAGFTQDITATLRQPIPNDPLGGEISTPYRVQLKSRSPLLAGTLLILHRPRQDRPAGVETDVQGAIQVNGHSVLWEDSQLAGDVSAFLTRSYDHPDMIAVSIRNGGGNPFAPTNFPFYLRSTGYDVLGGGGAPILDGHFNMMQLGDYPPPSPDPEEAKKVNTLHYKMRANSTPMEVDGSFNNSLGAVTGDKVGGERRVTIDLNNPALSPVIVKDGVFHVHFKGFVNAATAGDEPPGFILVRSRDLKTVTLENNNFRRLVVGMEAAHQLVDVNVINAANWRMLMSNTAAGVSFKVGGGNTLAVQGGIRSDSRVAVATGALVLDRELNPLTLELMDPREGWVEIYSDL